MEKGYLMLNFEEEVAKFAPSLEVDAAAEAVYDSINPDVADILGELFTDRKERKN